MRALILAAGLGERLRPLTAKRAKPAIEFLNIPMLAYPYYWLNTLGLSDVVFNTHHLPESIRHAAMRAVSSETRLHFSHEVEILGSGGGIWNARFDLMKERTFAVANGDGVVLSPDLNLFRKMLEQHEFDQALATILVCPLEGVGEKIPGVWVSSDGAVVGFGKNSPGGGARCWHYASYMLFSDELWPLLPEGSSNILYDVLEPRIKDGARVRAFFAPDLLWFETGNIPDYLNATRRTLEMIRDKSLHGRCALEIVNEQGRPYGLRSQLDQMKLIADSAEIDPSTRIRGFAVVGEKARVGSGSALNDCVVLSGASVGGLNVENSVVI
jgi:NDP-sugar pyrophosphorylase family protein